jgi:fructose-1,6-bisphosphatase/inositol monophosphatase family enzyme
MGSMRKETEAAIAAAQIAQGIADRREGADIIQSKGGIDLVTNTDVACEDAIRAALLRTFPDYPVIGEERGGAVVKGKPYWLVDPICGTRSFASNLPFYCTNIALVEDGIITVAAIAIGKTGEIVYAEKSKGARMRTRAGDRNLHATAESNMIWIDGKNEQAAETLRNALLTRRWYVCTFPSSVSGAYTAMGGMAAIIHFASVASSGAGSVHWAASCLVADEAGAIVTDMDTQREWSLDTRSFLAASTRQLHDDLLDLALRAGQNPA